MSEEIRAAVRDIARYLRQIRPIDPAEVVKYLESDVDAGVVHDHLRLLAVELALIERENGVFVPAKDGPITPRFDEVSRLPCSINRMIEQLLIDEYGPNWANETTGDSLRTVIRRFKRAYVKGEQVTYDRETALGYALYHLPKTFASSQYVLHELGQAGLIKSNLRVLDLGAGVGGQALGIDAYLPDDVLVDYHAVERSEAAVEMLEQFLTLTGRNRHTSIRTDNVEEIDTLGTFDLILLANVLTELETPVDVVTKLVDNLHEDGAIVAISPADKQTSRGLREIETQVLEIVDSYRIFSPTLRLWEGKQPKDNCWSFTTKPPLVPPGVQIRLDQAPRNADTERDPATHEFVNTAIRYSYSILRTDARRRIDFVPNSTKFQPLDVAASQVTNRVAIAVVKLSESLAAGEDQNALYVIGDGSQAREWFAVETVPTYINRHLREADYGDVLLIEDGLVLWNEDNAAYNVIIDGKSAVDRVTPTGPVFA